MRNIYPGINRIYDFDIKYVYGYYTIKFIFLVKSYSGFHNHTIKEYVFTSKLSPQNTPG